MPHPFNYDLAFSRNLGWFSEAEQRTIKQTKLAICGAGGVGAWHALNHARIGFSRFSLADFDQYEVENFNRQACAKLSNVKKDKVQALADELLDINPEAEITLFKDGVHAENVDDFLDGCDVYLDGLDFFAIDARRLVFQKCEEKRIPALTAAPLGFGTSVLCFDAESMSFEDYFGFSGKSELEQFARFYFGLSPKAGHSSYLIEPQRLDLSAKKGPSLNPGCMQASAAISANTVKLILGRGELVRAPASVQYDAFTNSSAITELPHGLHGAEIEAVIGQIVAAFSS
ncbi:ThiF family adenylyltransferase [Alteromonas flava]|uniref:ThiF family adenylyltransferase n=1 Tax=Alteromonas flava TaxID=2048003 RepID=UPI001F0B9684|nr:ThiF family adenylyltransferase [Alteromonas flava]